MTHFTRELLVLLHLLGVIAWVGGMLFAYFCLRPAASEILDPPKRLPLWVAALGRFLRYTAVSVVVIVLSGFTLLVEVGLRAVPVGWLVMAVLGLVMTLVFFYVDLVLFPRLRTQCLASAWPDAAVSMNGIRWLVATNLILALCTIAAAVYSR